MNDIIKSWNNHAIRIRTDRYVSLTDMAQATGKMFAAWHRLKTTKAYLKTFSSIVGINTKDLIQTQVGSCAKKTGTWGHPKVALRFAQWCSVDFAIQVDMWIDELLTTGRVELETNPTPIDQNLISNIQNLKLKIAQQPEIYRLIFSSRLKEATNFQQWVFEQVLPAICQTGMYLQLRESEFAPIAQPENLLPTIARTGNSSTPATPSTPGTGDTSSGFGGAGSGGTGSGGGDDGGDDDDDYNEEDDDDEWYRYDGLNAPIDLDEQFLQIDYVFDNLPYDCRQNLTMETQKRRVLQELIAAFPPNKKFLLSRDTAIALADAERYFTVEQLADRLERMAGMPVSADGVVNLLAEMKYIVTAEDLVEAITPTQSAQFFTRRVAGEIKWRANILQLLLWEFNWQMKNRKNGGRSV